MKQSTIHFVGIGGIGLSALARYFLAQNWPISGSDTVLSPEIRELRKEGIKVKIGHKKANISSETGLIIYSQAVLVDNPELLEGKRRGIPVKSYPEVLGGLTLQYKTIAVSGSHGKSTTSSLLALIFRNAGLDPTVIVGTKLKELNGKNFRVGKSKYMVIEADEYKDSFLNYYSEAALVTNIDREHLDYYKDLHNVKKSFLKFMNNLNPGGILVLNKDDKNLYSLKNKIRGRKIIWYSLKDKKDAKYVKQIEKHIKIYGIHNLSNALGAYKLAKHFGIKNKVILDTISQFKGTWRRMEYKGNINRIIDVYDDYAHHPTEIKATLQAFRKKYPNHMLVCVFQPHQIKRLRLLFDDFVKAFNKADILILLDVYKVSGREFKSKLSHNISCCNEMRFRRKTSAVFCNTKSIAKYCYSCSACLATSIQRKEVIYLPYPKDLKPIIYSLREPAIVVMMGAGDIVNITPTLLK